MGVVSGFNTNATTNIYNRVLKEMLHVLFAFSYMKKCLVYMYVQAIHMNITQIEVRNIRFWKARGQSPNAISEYRINLLARRQNAT